MRLSEAGRNQLHGTSLCEGYIGFDGQASSGSRPNKAEWFKIGRVCVWDHVIVCIHSNIEHSNRTNRTRAK